VLDKLQRHIKDQSNEALRKRAFSNCKQAEGETFSEFYVCLKTLSEEADLCKANDSRCEEAWIKHGILMGVRDEKLIQKLISMDASSTLQDAVTECCAYEAAKSTTSALRDPAAVCSVSQYRKGKKVANMTKAHIQLHPRTRHPAVVVASNMPYRPALQPTLYAVVVAATVIGHTRPSALLALLCVHPATDMATSQSSAALRQNLKAQKDVQSRSLPSM